MGIRTLVVGMGPRGQDWAQQIGKASQYELVGCVDVDEAVLTACPSKLAISESQCFTDLGKALDDNNVSAVIVATPAELHVGSCELALSRGIAVMVEKPFTTTLSDATRLVSLAAAKNTPLIVAQNYRYMRAFRAARQLISAGALGPVGMVICQYYRIPHQMAASLERMEHSILWGVGVHHLDMIRYVLDRRITRVLADSFKLSWGDLPNGSSMRLLLALEDGARVFYSSTYESSGHEFFERGQEFYARFVGQRATLHIFHRWLVLCETGKLPRFIRRGPRRVTEEQVLLDQLERALLTGEEPDSSGRDNLQTMAVVEACIRSAIEERWINPQELLNELS